MVNTTSRAGWSSGLSPFLIGPVKLYAGLVAQNVENAWQYSKCYKEHIPHGQPAGIYFQWAGQGWRDKRAHRYPMGKGAKPEYSWWDGEKLDYIQARRKIYCPLYARTVIRQPAFRKLRDMVEGLKKGQNIWLWDFDGYDHVALGMSYKDVLNCKTRKMGHAFVLAMMLDDERVWE